MLTLKRRIGQAIIINGNIKVVVTSIEGKKAVYISIDAPREVNIIREEVEAEKEDGHCTQ